jgi:alpha-beta hydrolase superfamily lysophospholipase
MSRPSILIIPGAAGLPELYDTFVEAVKEHGLNIEALALPSVRSANEANVTPPTMYEDATFIQSHIAKLADAGKDVVLLAHSYGGVPCTQSVEGLSKKEREAKGRKGGVVSIAYMTCLVPELGQPAMSVQASMPAEGRVPIEINVCVAPFSKPIVITESRTTGTRLDVFPRYPETGRTVL